MKKRTSAFFPKPFTAKHQGNCENCAFILAPFFTRMMVHAGKYIQGVRLEPSKSYCLLLPKYEQKGFFKHTGGSPDVVHLIKKSSQVFLCNFETNQSVVSKEAFL